MFFHLMYLVNFPQSFNSRVHLAKQLILPNKEQQTGHFYIQAEGNPSIKPPLKQQWDLKPPSLTVWDKLNRAATFLASSEL